MSMLTDLKKNTCAFDYVRAKKAKIDMMDVSVVKSATTTQGAPIMLLSTGSLNARTNRLTYQYQVITTDATPTVLYSRTVYAMTVSSDAVNVMLTCLNTAT